MVHIRLLERHSRLVLADELDKASVAYAIQLDLDAEDCAHDKHKLACFLEVQEKDEAKVLAILERFSRTVPETGKNRFRADDTRPFLGGVRSPRVWMLSLLIVLAAIAALAVLKAY